MGAQTNAKDMMLSLYADLRALECDAEDDMIDLGSLAIRLRYMADSAGGLAKYLGVSDDEVLEAGACLEDDDEADS